MRSIPVSKQRTRRSHHDSAKPRRDLGFDPGLTEISHRPFPQHYFSSHLTSDISLYDSLEEYFKEWYLNETAPKQSLSCLMSGCPIWVNKAKLGKHAMSYEFSTTRSWCWHFFFILTSEGNITIIRNACKPVLCTCFQAVQACQLPVGNEEEGNSLCVSNNVLYKPVTN